MTASIMDLLLLDDEEQDHGCCSSCHLVLKQPFIRCKTCKSHESICLECFSKGREFNKHKKSHKYVIVNEEFSVLEPDWTASEEVKLLEALLTKGEGNWEEISRLVPTKSPAECQRHYENQYLDNSADFPHFDTINVDRKDQPVIFAPSESSILRPEQRSALHKDLAGYNAARGDFDWESDNLAEMELNVIEANDELFEYVQSQEDDLENCDINEDKILVAALSAQALQVHNQRLKRRLRRKRVVKEFGLLNKPRSMSLPGRYPLISSRAKYDQLFKLGPRVQCSFDFDFLLEGLEHELGVRQQILRLQDYRCNGIRHPLAAAFYTKLRNQREAEVLERPRETILDFVRSAKARKGLKNNPLMTMTTRRSAGPLDILGLPCYEKLSEDERDLCSEARVLPEVFLDIKKILTEECEKAGGLRLADARPLVKIDVNKTRKLYDYLLKKELIYPPITKK